jgi:ketosteroid isomerase-like protein
MSRENVEIVRRAIEAYEHEGLDGSLRSYDPEIEWTSTDAYIERATYRGHEGAATSARWKRSSMICGSSRWS